MLSSFSIALTILPTNVGGATLFVGGGPGNYTTIQSAVNDANPGDTVYVYSGTYAEDVSVFESISIIGESRTGTVIRGTGTADTVLVTADSVTVNGFTMENSGTVGDEAGIRLFFVQNCLVTNNILKNNNNGISLRQSDNNQVMNNIFSNNGNGVNVWQSFFNRIENNSASNGTTGIKIDEASNNIVTDNVLFDNVYGIYMSDSSFVTFDDNQMLDNGIFLTGISLEHWNTHVLDTSNTVNGKPVYYWKNVTGGTVPAGAGEIILANCNSVIADNQNVSDGSIGFDIGYSSYITITNNIVFSNNYDGLYFYRSENSTIYGNTASGNGNFGFSLYHSPNNEIAQGSATGSAKDGIYILGSTGNSITGNDFSGNGNNGITLDNSDVNLVAANTAALNPGIGVYLYYSDVNNVVNNNFSNNGAGISLQGSNSNSLTDNEAFNTNTGISVWSSSHNLINDNVASSSLTAIHLSQSYDNTLIGNYASSDNTSYNRESMILWWSASNTLSSNVMVGNGLLMDGDQLEYWNTHTIDPSNAVNGRPVYYWKNVTSGTIPMGAGEVILANCSNVIVENQNLSGGTVGVEIGFSSDNLLANSTISENKVATLIKYSNGNSVFGNTITNNGNGAALSYSDFNDIFSNSISTNDRRGINLYISHNNTIASNEVWNNEDGIYLSNSNGNTVLDNNAFSNGDGIYLSASHDNRLFGNNIVDNGRQGFDNRDTSQWDNGYPIGGNFWSDYSGIDVMNGPNQNLPGSDGIGDTPYVIDADSDDRYPRMAPTIPLPPSAPLNLTAIAGDQQVSLSWNAPSFDGGFPIVNYQIYRGTTSGGEVFLAQIGNTPTYLDGGLTNGQTYYYMVSAFNGIGEGPFSNEANATPTMTPGPPILLEANLSGNGDENVTLKWSLSSDDGVGQNSVIGYEIHRNTTYDANGSGYQFTSSVSAGIYEFTDSLAGEGDPNKYYYRVCAVDLNGLRNCSFNQAGKFTRSLPIGPNLVSIPLVQSSWDIESVLRSLEWNKAWAYDSIEQKWDSHMRIKPYPGELGDVNLSMGIWVDVSEQSNLTVAGLVPSVTIIDLHAGWNLVGFPSFDLTHTVGNMKGATGASRVEGFDPLSSPYFLKSLMSGDVLLPGYGYWVGTETDALWIVDNL